MNQPSAYPVGRPESLTCFLVEDSLIIRENLIATLEEILGAQVLGSAVDERGALQWLDSEDRCCHLMIVDIFLKSGTGLTVLGRARSLRPEMKLVVLSNYATPEMRQRCLQLGADRVFDKSAELEELLNYCGTVAGSR